MEIGAGHIAFLMVAKQNHAIVVVTDCHFSVSGRKRSTYLTSRRSPGAALSIGRQAADQIGLERLCNSSVKSWPSNRSLGPRYVESTRLPHLYATKETTAMAVSSSSVIGLRLNQKKAVYHSTRQPRHSQHPATPFQSPPLRSSLLILKLAFNRTGLEFNSRVIAHWSISCLTPPRDVCPILNAHNVRAMFRKSQVFAMCCPVQTQRSHPKRLSGRSGFSIPRSGLKADASL